MTNPETVVDFYVGEWVIDPSNRVVKVVEVDEAKNTARVKLGGSYGANVFYPPTCLRHWSPAEKKIVDGRFRF